MREPFTYGGGTHVALRYASMHKKRPINVAQVLSLFPHKFSKPSRVQESFARLSKNGFLTSTPKGWVITDSGLEYLTKTAKQYVGVFE